MPIAPFELERYFALYEFKLKYLLSPSDCESLSMAELLSMASAASPGAVAGFAIKLYRKPGPPAIKELRLPTFTRIFFPGTYSSPLRKKPFLSPLQTLLRPGDQVVAIAPAYQSLHEIARSIAVR